MPLAFDSASHGRRYVNVYVNPSGRDYGELTKGEKMPVGTLIAKDSFSLTAEGELLPGPLFVMEKMGPGFNYVSGDWRYVMIMPDGEIFGVTKGINAKRVYYSDNTGIVMRWAGCSNFIGIIWCSCHGGSSTNSGKSRLVSRTLFKRLF